MPITQLAEHFEARGTRAPQPEDFIGFGSLSSLERLRRDLAKVVPEFCGPLRLAIQSRRRGKTRRRGPQGLGGQRGPQPRHTVPLAQLPGEWQAALATLRRLRREKDMGFFLPASTVQPPTMRMIDQTAHILRSLAHVADAAGLPVALDREAVGAWLEALEQRGRAPSGISLQLRLLRRFVLSIDPSDPLAPVLGAVARDYTARARRTEKRKSRFLRGTPLELGGVLDRAEAVALEAREAAPGSRRRAVRWLHAAALALPVALPLRIGDLCRLRLGKELRRSAEGWSVDIRTHKTGSHYKRALWPEVTPYLDGVLLADAASDDLWTAYDSRVGTPLFSLDGGQTGLSADWISDVWYQELGTGAHSVRTLWHQLASDGPGNDTWLALALCGQSSERTAAAYRVDTTRRRTARSGQQRLRALRERQALE